MCGPLVTVLIATHDEGEALARTVEHLSTGQTLRDFEIVVMDDGSTDGSAERIGSGGRIPVRVHRMHHRGLSVALEQGLPLCAGELVARHDVGDRSHPDRLRVQVDWLRARPRYMALATAAIIEPRDGGSSRRTPHVPSPLVPLALRFGNCVVHGSVMMRRRAAVAAGGYRSGFQLSQDFDLWTRLSECGAFGLLRAPLYTWVDDPSGLSSRRRGRQVEFAGLAAGFFAQRRSHGTDDYRLYVDGGKEPFAFAISRAEAGDPSLLQAMARVALRYGESSASGRAVAALQDLGYAAVMPRLAHRLLNRLARTRSGRVTQEPAP